MTYLKRSFVIVLILIVFLSTGSAQTENGNNSPMIKGRVMEVAYGEPMSELEENWEIQILKIKLVSGPDKNKIITLSNLLTGHPFFDIAVTKGDRVLIQKEQIGEEEYQLVDYSRQNPLLIITILFALSVIIIGGIQGIKALVSLLVMGLVIVTMILPLVLKGYNPIIVTVGISSAITSLFIVFVGGYSKKTIAATCGTMGGLITSGLLAFLIGKAAYLTGLASEEAQMLQFMDSTIDVQGLLFSGMIIGALGAILDVGISIASAMEQIKEADPKTDFQTLFTRGLHVGRDLIATMSNTLILAYVGSALPLLLLFQAHENQWLHTLNLDLVATEIVRAMTGSIGLTLAIPITAFIAALLFVKPQNKGEDLSD